MKYRFSASSISTYKGCKFRFYCKSTKQDTDGETNQMYGNAGTIVHDTLEYYYTHLRKTIDEEFVYHELEDFFNGKWEEKDTGNLNKDLYWLCVINGKNLNLEWTHLEHMFHFTDPVEFVGYADIMNVDENWIGDWKTSTYKKSKVEDYKNQLRYYAYAYRKEFKKNPMCWVYFNKANKIFKFQFDDVVLDNVGIELIKLKREVETRIKEEDWPREPSNKTCFFCPYKGVCATDLLKPKPVESNTIEIKFHLKDHKLKIEGEIPLEVREHIESKVNFEVKNAHFMRQAMKARGQIWDGIKRLYRVKPFGGEAYIGHLDLVYRIFKTYYEKRLVKVNMRIIDHRSKAVMETKMFELDKLNVPFDFHNYQGEAVDTLLRHRWGIAEIGTGGGKTAIAAECIRRIGGKTLFIIDNKDLLLQTKKEYEEMLGFECGVVGMGEATWDKHVTLATIQTLAKHLQKFQNQLSTFNVVIYDETHIIAAKSFENLSKYLINTRYRLGFSATAKRDDGNDNIIFAHTGPVVYKKKALDLIKEGHLVKPRAIFYTYDTAKTMSADWNSEYVEGIVNNEARNKLILDVARKYVAEGKKVMILCKLVAHCKYFLENTKFCKSDLIYGKTDNDVRVDVMEAFRDGDLDILIGNIKIFNKGINIKNLDVLINAAGNAGDVVTIQTMGRILRKSPGKEEAYYIDFMDEGEYLRKHSRSRIDALKVESYPVEIISSKNI